MLLTVLVVGVFQFHSPLADGPAPYSRALGRPLSWDRYGMYPFEADGPLPNVDAEIVAQMVSGELGRAEVASRSRLERDGNDPLPAWALGQIFRAKRIGLAEYRRNVEQSIDAIGSPAILLYRIQVCRIAEQEVMKSTHSQDQTTIQRMDRQMADLRSRCLPYAKDRLGTAIGLTLVPSADVLSNRKIWETYFAAHPKGVDVRPMLCLVYNHGAIYGSGPLTYTYPDGHTVRLHYPDEPQPKKALEIAQAILRDRPNDPMGHFSAGRSYFGLKEKELAVSEIQKALDTGKLPMFYARAAEAFLNHPSDAAFRPDVPY